jgi:hypothetical protein
MAFNMLILFFKRLFNWFESVFVKKKCIKVKILGLKVGQLEKYLENHRKGIFVGFKPLSS